MSSTITSSSRVTFGLFEADLKSGELWKAGRRIKLQSQPFKVLTVLLENAGEVVSREQLQQRVWGPNVVVDFEHSLGSAIKKVREALGDSAENPRFIETLSKRGYRFIAPVSFPTPEIAASEQVPTVVSLQVAVQSEPERLEPAPQVAAVLPGHGFRLRSWQGYSAFIAAFFLGAVVAGTLGGAWRSPVPRAAPPRISHVTDEGRVYSSVDTSFESLPATVTDGTRLFTSAVEDGQNVLSEVTISTGEFQTLPLPGEIASPEIDDISADGSELLVQSHLSAAPEMPLWVVPVDGGSAFRVSSVLAHDATWMPDGKNILYAYGNQLNIVSLETGQSTSFASIPARAFWLRWSPDGKRLRFTLIDSVNHTSSLWEIDRGNNVAHPLLKGWDASHDACCGVWTSDGAQFFFQATIEGGTDLWRLTGDATSRPLQVTNGPLYDESPAAGRNKNRIFFVGHDYHSRTETFDARAKQFVPLDGFLAHAIHVSFSRDRKRVIWIDPVGRLWRAKVDGTDKVQLTPESMSVFLAAWSPDGTQVALMARYPGDPWQIFTVNANGGSPEPLMQQQENVADPSFSADGKYLAFGGVPNQMGQGNTPHAIEILELATHRITELAHSRGLFSPRWSPDGRYIVALTLDQQKVMLYDTARQTWKVLAITSAEDPVWSSDSKALYIHAYMDAADPICRIDIATGHAEPVAGIRNFSAGTISRYFFDGLSLENAPIVHVELDNSNLYSLDLPSRAGPDTK